MKKRIVYLEIDGKRFGSETGDHLNVSFDVPYAGTGFVPTNSSFTLTNLNKDDLFEVVTNTARFIERKRKIKCFAGYEGAVEQIFGGEILQSNPTDLPDTSVNITAFSNIQSMGEQIEVEYNNPTLFDIVDDARKSCGYGIFITEKVRNSSILQTRIPGNWSFSGSTADFLRETSIMLANQVRQSKEALSFVVANNILYIGWQNERFPGTIPVISAESGMIGIPSPTEAGINLRILLDVSLQPLQTIYIKSNQLSLYNGLYNIINIRHRGSLRGRDWYTDLECVRVENDKATI